MRIFRSCVVLWKRSARQAGAPQSRFLLFCLCAPSVIYQLWRHNDFRFHRSYGGLAGKFLKIDGHAPLAFLLPAVFLLFFVHGPSLGWRGPALAVLASAYALVYLTARRPGNLGFLKGQLLVFAGLSGILWWAPELLTGSSDSLPLESGDRLYRHILVPAFLWLAALPLFFSGWFADRLLRSHRGSLRNLLPHAELLSGNPCVPVGATPLSALKVALAFFTTPIRYPLHLLFWPSAILILAPDTAVEKVWAAAFVIVTWLLLGLASVHTRFQAMLGFFRRALFVGGQLIVSLCVILLGIGRLAGVSYVETVLEAGAKGLLVLYIATAYSFLWLFEYWLNRTLCEHLINVLGGNAGQVAYKLAPNHPCLAAQPHGRVIQVHAGARLAVIGRSVNGLVKFRTFEKSDFFDELWRQAALDPSAKPLLPRARTTIADLRRATSTYFASVNVLLAVLSLIVGLWAFNWKAPLPVVEIPSPDSEPIAAEPFDLAAAIEAKASQTGRGNLILLAASGGGSRAALYAASQLRGLEALGVLDDLVLASGVSGGGVALAAYAGRRESPGRKAAQRWDQLSCDLSFPFIHDVLSGLPESRLVGGVRSGRLLAESFGRELSLGLPGTGGPRPARLGDVTELGLILNATLAGNDAAGGKSGLHAGGRLIFTNLAEFEAPPPSPRDPLSRLAIPYVVIRDPRFPLAGAAALNANFPPVFSNAPIDLGPGARFDITPAHLASQLVKSRQERNRFLVTDGGATDNRGLISLLLALRTALPSVDPPPGATLPKLHVIMAEASAGSTRYAEDRGIGSKLEATGKVANQLISELLEDVRQRYESKGGELDWHDLSMPKMFRIDGGLGTHWMLPTRVELRHAPTNEEVVLDRYATRYAINRLHGVGHMERPPPCPGDAAGYTKRALRWVGQRALGWTTQEDSLRLVEGWVQCDPHRTRWNELCRELSGSDCLPQSPVLRVGE